MSNRINRLVNLGRQLQDVMCQMAEKGASGGDAVVFFDLLRRCQTFTAEEVSATDVGGTITLAESVLAKDGAALGQIAESVLEIDSLVRRACEFADGGNDDADEIIDLALRVATIAQDLPKGGRAKALAAVERIAFLVLEHPVRFQDGSAVGEDREFCEHPVDLPEPAATFALLITDPMGAAAEDAAAERAWKDGNTSAGNAE